MDSNERSLEKVTFWVVSTPEGKVLACFQFWPDAHDFMAGHDATTLMQRMSLGNFMPLKEGAAVPVPAPAMLKQFR